MGLLWSLLGRRNARRFGAPRLLSALSTFQRSALIRLLALAGVILAVATPVVVWAHARHHAHMIRRTPARAEPVRVYRMDPAVFARLSPELQQKVLHLRGVRVAPEGPAMAFGAPLPGFTVNSRFGLRQLSFEPRARMHDGVDIAAPIGVPIRAVSPGAVVRTGVSPTYGRFVEVSHGGGVTTFYAHMSKTAGLKPGAYAPAGAVLGYVGSTGRSTGPHLHFEVLVQGVYQDPQKFLTAGKDLRKPVVAAAAISSPPAATLQAARRN